MVPVIALAQIWALPGTLPYAAGAPIISLLLAYLYFPLATAKRALFDKHNTLKSIAVGLAAYEIYRQLLAHLYGALGISFGGFTRQHCGLDVDTLQSAISCGVAQTAALIGSNLLLWLAPAALLLSISRRRQTLPSVRSEA